MVPPLIHRMLALTVSLIPAAGAPVGLAPPLYVPIESTTPIADSLTSVSSITEVAALLTATQISAQAAADLSAMFAQSPRPALVYVATYDAGAAEDVTDALDRAEAAVDFGAYAIESRIDAANELAAGWASADQDRLWRHPFIAQTASADALTSGKPAALEDCETDTCAMHYAAATESQAAAALAVLSGFSLASGPYAMRHRILGVALPVITAAQAGFAFSSDIGILRPLGMGSSASQRVVDMTRAYSGVGFSGAISLVYTVRRLSLALQAVVLRHAILATPLRATYTGAAEVQSACAAVLSELAAVGHYVPGELDGVALPDGWRVLSSITGTTITLAVTVLIGQEAITIALGVTGEEQ